MAPERRGNAPARPWRYVMECRAKATEVVKLMIKMLWVVCIRTIPLNDAQKTKEVFVLGSKRFE